MDLTSLLLRLDALDTAQIEQLGRDWYHQLYITTAPGRYGVLQAHDGQDVIFWADRFEHAFFTSSDRARYPNRKDKLAEDRIARVRWIGEVIAGQVPGSACWEGASPQGRLGQDNRLYVVSSERYVVWLEPTKRGWKFSTAYPAWPVDIRRYCNSGRKMWQWKENAP